MAQVVADLTDLEAIKVHGDWLLARDDPQGEAIQLACTLETLGDFDPQRPLIERRLAALVETGSRVWCAAVAETAPVASRRVGERVKPGLVRGLPAHLEGRPNHLVAMLDAAAAVAPIVSLRPIFARAGQLAPLAQTATFRRLTRLALDTRMEATDPDIDVLFGEDLPMLERLSLARAGSQSLAAVARSGVADHLTHLELRNLDASLTDLAPVLGARLVSLRLHGLPLGCDGIAAIAQRCPGLRVLTAERCSIDTKALELLATHRAFAGLVTLELGGNPHKAAGLVALGSSKTLANVARLSLRRFDGQSPPFGAKLLEALLGAVRGKQLRALDLERCNIRVEGAAVLAAAKSLASLQELRLGFNALGDDGIAALAKSRTLGALRVVDIAGNTITAKGMAALGAAPWLARVEELVMRHNKVGAAGGLALATAGNLEALRVLHLGQNWLGESGMHAILAAADRIERIEEPRLNSYGATIFDAFVESDTLALTHLRLAAPTAEAYAKLATSPRAASLRELMLFPAGPLDAGVATALAASPHLTQLGTLDISSGIPDDARAILEQRFGPRVAFV
ncbi:MAG: hypothetical protein ABI867_06500 [Kofleriaceae bacterium]